MNIQKSAILAVIITYNYSISNDSFSDTHKAFTREDNIDFGAHPPKAVAQTSKNSKFSPSGYHYTETQGQTIYHPKVYIKATYKNQTCV